MFPLTARHLYTQFLRIFAHLYHAHFSQIVHLSLEGHLNSLFAHFLVFGKTYNLLDPKECRAPKENWGFVIGDLMVRPMTDCSLRVLNAAIGINRTRELFSRAVY